MDELNYLSEAESVLFTLQQEITMTLAIFALSTTSSALMPTDFQYFMDTLHIREGFVVYSEISPYFLQFPS